jgi:hypothetical protein
MDTDTIVSLYQHGALLPAGILTVYLLLRWGVGNVPWLKEPKHAHYATAIVAGLAVLAAPAAAGTTPDLNHVISAVLAIAMLMMPGVSQPKPDDTKKPEGGSVRLVVMLVIALAGCSWFGTKAKTMTGAFATCAKADLGQVIHPATGSVLDVVPPGALLSFVDALVNLDGAALEAQLAELGGIVTTDAVKCAIASIDAVMSPPGQTAMLAPRGLLRAKAWSAAH